MRHAQCGGVPVDILLSDGSVSGVLESAGHSPEQPPHGHVPKGMGHASRRWVACRIGVRSGDVRMLPTMSWPPAEVEIDEALVRSLLADQHPDLAILDLAPVGHGWDNALWRLGDDLVVRLPRRALAAPILVHEQTWLPLLAPRLPLPVPVPVRVGQPTDRYPWRWSIVPWLIGSPADRSPVHRAEDAAGRLGRFLRALHTVGPPDAPHNPYRGVPLGDRSEVFEDRVTALADQIDVGSTRLTWDRAVAVDSWTAEPVWLHGDLHPANILLSRGTVTAVIDFGDLCTGDPATDLAAGWMLLPVRTMTAFHAAYGGIDEALDIRARGWAALFALMLLGIGLDGRPSYETVGRRTLAGCTSPFKISGPQPDR